MTKLLDTNIILYHLGGKLLNPLPSDDYVISVITEIELLSYPMLDVQSENQIKKFLSNLTIVDLSSEVKDKAIELRRKLSLKLPDAIIAATAFVTKAQLLSNDQKLLQVPNLTCHQLDLID